MPDRTHNTAPATPDVYKRQSQYMVDEFKRFLAGAPLKWDVTEKMLETMA